MIIQIPKRHMPVRDPGPYPKDRVCSSCPTVLNRNNNTDMCAPCQLAAMPACEVIDLYPQDAA